jgi:hypothetical protein
MTNDRNIKMEQLKFTIVDENDIDDYDHGIDDEIVIVKMLDGTFLCDHYQMVDHDEPMPTNITCESMLYGVTRAISTNESLLRYYVANTIELH